VNCIAGSGVRRGANAALPRKLACEVPDDKRRPLYEMCQNAKARDKPRRIRYRTREDVACR